MEPSEDRISAALDQVGPRLPQDLPCLAEAVLPGAQQVPASVLLPVVGPRYARSARWYVYTNDDAVALRFQRETSSGGFCVNAAAAQASMATLGFGGIGRSGYGRHHGHDGFKEFSNPRGAFVYGKAAGGLEVFLPPYTAGKRLQIELLFGLRRFQLRVARTIKPGSRRR